MPDLNTLLDDTMLHTAAKGAGAKIVNDLPATLPKASPDSSKKVEDKPIWHYEHSGRLNEITDLTCCVKSMKHMEMPASMKYMEMTVCSSICWEPVTIVYNKIKYTLELSEEYKICSEYLDEGTIPDSGAGFWRLEAHTDKSFQHVFGYQLTEGSTVKKPILPKTYKNAGFMAVASASSDSKTKTAAPKTGGKHPYEFPCVYVLVVVSFVCCKERNDFEPFGVLGAGRIYPTVMVMANKPLEGLTAEIIVNRPEKTPHTEMDGEKMLPPLRASFFADRNESVLLPFWDGIFSHYLIDPTSGNYAMVDPTKPGRSIDKAVQHCGSTTVLGSIWPSAPKDAPFYKQARQEHSIAFILRRV